MTLKHFNQRCIERGITVCPDALWSDLRLAMQMIRTGDSRADQYVERVPSPHGELWRFRVSDGMFYAAIADQRRAVTILTQDMYRNKRFAAKMKRKGLKRP